MTITNALGNEVTLPSKPTRIVSLAPSNTEILFAIGAGDQVIGVTSFCNYPPEAETRDQIGGFSARTISVEKIVALKPDLVFAAGSIHQPIIEALNDLDIPVVSLTGESVEQCYSDIELSGRLTGNVDGATAVVTDMKTRIQAVQTKLMHVPAADRLRVFWQVWDEPLMTAGPKTFVGEMIDLAGGVHIFAELEEKYPQVSAEEVLKRNPAVILGPDSHGDKLTPEIVGQRAGWSQMDAVRNERIHLIQGDMASRNGPRIADAVEAMAQALYPDLFQ
jgi:iron complex transport system substrate-binding protein